MENSTVNDQEKLASEVEQLLRQRRYHGEHHLLAALEDVQARFGHIPAFAMPVVARCLSLSPTDVEKWLKQWRGALRTEPPVACQICHGPVCINAGASELEVELAVAGIHCRKSHCLGACDHAPVVRIGDVLISEASMERVRKACLSGC